MVNLLQMMGFEVKPKQVETVQKTVVPPPKDDGAFIVDAGGINSFLIDQNVEQALKTDADCIRKYREIARMPEGDIAISDICDESIVTDDTRDIVSLNLEDTNLSEAVKKKLQEEFSTILKLLDFRRKGYDIFRKWYVDARLYYQIMIDTSKPQDGIKELRPISPFRIKKVTEIDRTNQFGQKSGSTIQLINDEKSYFVYTDDTLKMLGNGVKFGKDSIAYVHSGYVNDETGAIEGYLHKAIKIANMLRMVEDGLLVYRIARAPERRVFYIDVTSLPKQKAEEYIKSQMAKYKNRMTYDPSTGKMKDNTHTMAMLEDFWLPRRDGGRGTEVTTLQGGQNLGEIEDINYFLKQFYKALNVPTSRLEDGSVFNVGRPSEITRDELKFAKFISRIQQQFSELFMVTLRMQLILKNVIKANEWDDIKQDIKIAFAQDSYYEEIKKSEMLKDRLNTLSQINEFIGTYYSKEWVRKNVLYQSEEEIKEIDNQIEEELANDEVQLGTRPGAVPGAMDVPQVPEEAPFQGPGPMTPAPMQQAPKQFAAK